LEEQALSVGHVVRHGIYSTGHKARIITRKGTYIPEGKKKNTRHKRRQKNKWYNQKVQGMEEEGMECLLRQEGCWKVNCEVCLGIQGRDAWEKKYNR